GRAADRARSGWGRGRGAGAARGGCGCGARGFALTHPPQSDILAMGSRAVRDRMHFRQWTRRDFITLLGGAAAASSVLWPLAARAQPERMRRIGVLTNLADNDPEGQARHAAFLQGLQESGWVAGRNLRIEQRWTGGDADRGRKYAAEFVALEPDVILPTGSARPVP